MAENKILEGIKNKKAHLCMLIPTAIFELVGIVFLLKTIFGEIESPYVWYTHPNFFIGLGGILLAAIFAIPYWAFSKVEITVTDKRVYGKAAFGRRVDLPIDSISAVAIVGIFNAISVATASGTIKFQMMKNYDELHAKISSLLVARQDIKKKNTTEQTIISTPLSNAEELKKYKDLLDAGIITQEEFDAKKKQLLGL